MKSHTKSKGRGKGLVHPSFPPQATPMAAHMGSQSMSPSPMGETIPPGMPDGPSLPMPQGGIGG